MTWRSSAVGFYREGKIYDFVTPGDLLKYTPAPLFDRIRVLFCALALMGGIGMLITGLVASPQMGKIADTYLAEQLPAVETTAWLGKVVAEYPALKAQAKGKQGDDIQAAIRESNRVSSSFSGARPAMETAALASRGEDPVRVSRHTSMLPDGSSETMHSPR